MDQAPTKWGSGLKANEGNVSATEPSRTLRSRGRRRTPLPPSYRRSVVVIVFVVVVIVVAAAAVIVTIVILLLYNGATLRAPANGSPERRHTGLVVHVIEGDSDD